MNFDSPISDFPIVVLDTETTGGYAVGDEICEVALVRYEKGKVVGEYQSLINPHKLVPPNIIKIHGITNEELKDAPDAELVMPDVYEYLKDSIMVAHHAPFDLGFIAYTLDKLNMSLPVMPSLCTSLLSRKLFPKSPNHRLQTLIGYFGLEKGTAHRALDDSYACLGVYKECIESFDEEPRLKDLIATQGKRLDWNMFSIDRLVQGRPGIDVIVDCIKTDRNIEFNYGQKAKSDKPRLAKPIGIVRSPDGDFLYAHCLKDNKPKRFYLSKITNIKYGN
ncbi:MAG: exonuclease domain-containing protein [Bdellovibrionales bacterium]